MAESNSHDYEPIFTCEADFERIWCKDQQVKSKCFSDVTDEIIANSFVFKSFRNEFETEHLFNKKNIAALKSGKLTFDNLTQRKGESTSSIPGYKPESFMASKSFLTRTEMTTCLAMYQELCNNKTLNNEMLTIYNEYIGTIKNEQTKYQNVAKDAWTLANKERMREIKPEIVDYTNQSWKERLERVSWYPKHYKKVADISLLDPGEHKSSELVHVELAKHVGPLPHYAIPDLRLKKLNAFQHIQELKSNDSEDHLSVPNSYKKVHKALQKIGYHPDVSKDEVAEKIALKNQVNIVLSASGFLHLIDNHPKSIAKQWDLPILVKEYTLDQGIKKIIYIDKALPKKSLSAVERNKWFAKVHLNKLLKVHHKIPKNTSAESDPTTYFDRDAVDDQLPSSPSSDNEFGIDPNQSDFEAENEDHRPRKRKPYHKKFYEKISYNLWSLKSEKSSVLLKSNLKDLDLLIRCKSGGKGIHFKSDHYRISPKLEYQTEYGAECCTISEELQDWANILIRPGIKLLRTRFDALTGEIVMFEEKTVQDLSREIKRLYSFNTHYRLNCLQLILGQMSELEPGSYLLSYSPEKDIFAQLYKEESNKPTYNLALNYQNIDPTTIAAPKFYWCPIDQFVITPTCQSFNRIPAMFYPKKEVEVTSIIEKREKKVLEKKSSSKKKKKKTKKKVEPQKPVPKTIEINEP